jgi:2-methylcitrate dehydratase PrpD
MAEYGAAELNLDFTHDLAGFLARLRYEDLPEAVVQECRRGILDWIGCALAGSTHQTIDTLAGVLTDVSPQPAVTVLGRKLKLGLLEAPIANGQMGHVLDYDDTHMGGVILHTSSPVLAAILALAEREGLGGRDLMVAYVAGFEAGVRAGQAAPAHHDGGWHLTGTLGSIAAGAACGRLLGLDATALTHALGIATTQASGMQQNRGTMCKSFHAGKAASNGVLAALLARRGFDSSHEILEGKKGFCRIYSAQTEADAIVDGLGERWEITRNGYKPYACGVVLHPVIDTTIALGKESDIAPSDVQSIELRVNAKAVTITGVAAPKTGLKSKFSIAHASAVGYIDGTAGIPQFSNDRAMADDVVALREKISVTTNEALRPDQARGVVTGVSGERHEVSTQHATGTVGNPMSDEDIAAKFTANAEPVIGAKRAAELRDLVWRLDALPDLNALFQSCA